LCAQTQPSPKPFTKEDVLKLLTGNVPVKRVETLVRERGVDFQVTPETESELRKAGATDPLLVTLRDLAPKPPTLVVTTTPGGAQVFVDDELIAKTSAEGRLKISNLIAGPHKLRVSLDGYRDHEESVNLMAGKTLEVPIPLDRITHSSLPAPKAESTDVSGERGTAGASAASQSTPGETLTRTGDLTCVKPGSWQDVKIRSWQQVGTITVGNGKLQFRATKTGKDSVDVYLADVVPAWLKKDTLRFDTRVQNRTVVCKFLVRMDGKDESANEQAAKELYDALKAGSK
jgi:hypothetical protein